MKPFAKIVKGFYPLNTFAKLFIFDVRQGSEHASEIDRKLLQGRNLNDCEMQRSAVGIYP